MNDKLKEIRDKHINVWFDYTNDLFTKATADNDVEQIQSETYQLGRDEVIEEIEKWIDNNFVIDYDCPQDYRDDLMKKLTQLKSK